ncbi:MAG: ATP-binding protein [Verrucomicrobia bacterium]|nr:ATP-binding protein [Verrucomicrobiota bacterium]
MTKQTLYIIRGLPGSGKSFLASQISRVTGALLLEADQFFIRDEQYRFDAGQLNLAHSHSIAQAEFALSAGMDVIVANTFTTPAEMQPYIHAAQKNAAPRIIIIRCDGTWKSRHNVPVSVVHKMRERWQDHPGEISAIHFRKIFFNKKRQCNSISQSRKTTSTILVPDASTGATPTTDTATDTESVATAQPRGINSDSRKETPGLPRVRPLLCDRCRHQVCAFPPEDKYAHSKGYPTTGCLICDMQLPRPTVSCTSFMPRPAGMNRPCVYRR